jgi:DNA polymerase III subunit delta
MPLPPKALTYQEFIKGFSQHLNANCFLVFGADDYLKKRVVDLIIEKVLPKEFREFDFVIQYGDEAKVADIIDNLDTGPFMADRKLILLKKYDKLKTAEQQKLVGALEKGNNSNVLVMTAETFDSRLKISKAILKMGPVVNCRSPYKHEDMIPWLVQEVRAAKKSIDERAAMLFVNKVDLDYMTASQELEKLLIFCKDTKAISPEDVQTCTGDSVAYSVFDLLNAVGDRNIRKSFVILENMLENDESILLVIAMLNRFFLQIWRINSLKQKRVPDFDITSHHLNDVYYLFRKNHLRYATRYPLKIIPEVFRTMLETDIEIKSTDIDHKVVIERMLFRILSL